MSEAGLTSREKLRYGAEAVPFFFFMGLFRLLGVDAASALGGWIGRSFGPLLPPDRTARANLKAAFPEKSEAERDAIRMAMWDNLGRVVGEYPHLGKFIQAGPNPRVSYTMKTALTPQTVNPRGIMFLSGHFANWEMMPITAHQAGYDGVPVVRPPNNPYVARYIERQRGLAGPRTQIAKQNAARRMLAVLKAGKVLYMLVDQKNNEGVPAPFFGRDAMTTPAPAAFALKLDVPMVICVNKRLGGARFHITVHPGPDFTPSGDEPRDIQRLTEIINRRIEELVRDDPGQWLWIHRRWPMPKDAAQMSLSKR
jgi:Kdo2-lipid IVA lauroyltransferase/acyltransferase